MLLLVHGEVTAHEAIYLTVKRVPDTVLALIVNDFPNLKIVLEHITTVDAATFVKNANENVAATNIQLTTCFITATMRWSAALSHISTAYLSLSATQ